MASPVKASTSGRWKRWHELGNRRGCPSFLRPIASNDPTAHGEIMAIRDACERAGNFDLQGCHIYTSGEPCPMCLGAIYWARIEHVFYGFSIHAAESCGFDDRRFFQQLALPREQRDVGQTQVLGEEAFAVLQQYLGKPDRVPY